MCGDYTTVFIKIAVLGTCEFKIKIPMIYSFNGQIFLIISFQKIQQIHHFFFNSFKNID